MTFRFIYVFCTIIVQENFFEKWRRKKKKKLLQKSLKLWPSFNANYLRRKSSLFSKKKNHKIYFSERIKKRPWSFEREKCLGFVFFLAMIIMNRGFFTQQTVIRYLFQICILFHWATCEKAALYLCLLWFLFYWEFSMSIPWHEEWFLWVFFLFGLYGK